MLPPNQSPFWIGHSRRLKMSDTRDVCKDSLPSYQTPDTLKISLDSRGESVIHSAVLSPLILPSDLVLLFWGEVILDIEGLANLLRGLAFDHVGNGLTADIK